MHSKSPYSFKESRSFWRESVVKASAFDLHDIYSKKFAILPQHKIALAGSCFAQYLYPFLQHSGFNVLDVEKPPSSLKPHLHKAYGFATYSARYGNIYTSSQFLQLISQAFNLFEPQNYLWEKNGAYYDALRPSIFPDGLSSILEVYESRSFHLKQVRNLFLEFDVFIFTMGMTEAWFDSHSNTCFPSAPGVIAGNYETDQCRWHNESSNDIVENFTSIFDILTRYRQKPFKFILSVSPVPLKATGGSEHVLVANTLSKSSLRVAASELSKLDFCDYFPSFELCSNPKLASAAYKSNLRDIKPEFVTHVLKHFLSAHQLPQVHPNLSITSQIKLQCEEELIHFFSSSSANQTSISSLSSPVLSVLLPSELNLLADISNDYFFEIIGDSHLVAFVNAMQMLCGKSLFGKLFKIIHEGLLPDDYSYAPLTLNELSNVAQNKKTYYSQPFLNYAESNYTDFSEKTRIGVILVGRELHGDGILRRMINLNPDQISEQIKNSPPIISCESEVNQSVLDSFLWFANQSKKIIGKIHEFHGDGNFSWVASPQIPDKSARAIFGNHYVDSRSHIIYTQRYEQILSSIINESVPANCIYMHDSCRNTLNGFLKNKYGAFINLGDIHANSQFFLKPSIKILEKVSKLFK